MALRGRRAPRPTSDPLKSLADDIADLKKRLAQLENGATSSGAVVRSKAMLVKNGAALHVQDEEQATRFYMGKLEEEFDGPDGSIQTGMVLRRQDGSPVFSISDPLPGESGFRQFWAFWDMSTNLVLGDDVNSGEGLASPWVPIPVFPSKLSGYTETTSASFERMWEGVFRRENPKVSAMVWVQCDPGTAGEVRLRANNITMASDTCPSGSWSNYFLGPQVSPGNIGDLMDIAIEARRTSGSGSIRLVPSYVRGEQS